MSVVSTIERGVECSAGVADCGWYVVALRRCACDEEYLESSKPEKFHLRAGITEEQWYDALDALEPRELVLATAGGVDSLAHNPERIIGPACPSARTRAPVAAWSQLEAGSWKLRLLVDGSIRTIHVSTSVHASPSVERHGNHCFVACVVNEGAGRKCVVFDETGREVCTTDLAYPKLCSAGETLYLLGERIEADSIRLDLINVQNGKAVSLHPQAPMAYAYHGEPRPGGRGSVGQSR